MQDVVVEFYPELTEKTQVGPIRLELVIPETELLERGAGLGQRDEDFLISQR